VLHALARSGLVLAGILLLAVGVGNVVAGQSKVAQYTELATLTTPRTPRAPATLFPVASEGEERHELAGAKKAFYELLVTAGWLLVVLGAALIAIGALRTWTRMPRAAPRSRLAN
jgi:uncharacterized membrane protein